DTYYPVSFVRDDHGFRNPTPWPDKVDWVIAGDSFTAAEAIQTPFWDNIDPSMLEFGLRGAGNIEEATFLHAYGLPRSPKVVIMAYFAGNDLNDNWSFYSAKANGKSIYDQQIQDYATHQPWKLLVTFNALLWLRDRILPKPCNYPVKDSFGHQWVFDNPYLSL